MTLSKVALFSLSPWQGASSGCGWRRWPPITEGSCEYIK